MARRLAGGQRRKEMSTDAIASPALETRALRVSYGRTRVIDALTMTVSRGSVYALLGRNGAGKSSLIRVLLGERPPTAGSVRLLGEDPWQRRTALMERVGIVPERPNAPPEMSAHALSAFCARLYRRWDAKLVEDRFARFDVPRDRPFGTLSKGQKGAVMLALALGHSPELLLLDDPTLGLDVVARDAVYGEVIGDLADRGTTVFLTTHDLRAAEGVADRVAILHKGAIALEGSLEQVKAEWGRPLEEIFAAVVAGSPNVRASQAEVRS
jgi:ABC-2 type transport system ATP-binding protein